MLSNTEIDDLFEEYEEKHSNDFSDEATSRYVNGCSRIYRKHLANPYLHKLAAAVNFEGNDPPAITLPETSMPWHALAIRSAAVCDSYVHAMSAVRTGVNKKSAWEALGVAMFCHEAAPYLWLDFTASLIDAMPPVPAITITPDLLPLPIMLFVTETTRDVPVHPQNQVLRRWTLIHHVPEGILVCSMFSEVCDAPPTDHPSFNISKLVHAGDCDSYLRHFIQVNQMKYDTVYPSDYGDDPHDFGYILKQLSFISSPMVISTRQRPPRQMRRQIARQHPTRSDRDDYASVVTLRQLHKRKKSEPSSTEERNRYHHWWVSGHYRNQPCGKGRKNRRLVWIPPHIRGDLNLPLKEKVYDVSR